MKKLFLAAVAVLWVCLVYAQSVGIGTNNPSGKFHISNSPSGSDALFFVDTTGNVGIGTKHPQNKLEVTGKVLAQSARILSYSPVDQPLRVEHYLSMIDQEQNIGINYSNDFNPGWQSFTAGMSGRLDSVSLELDTKALAARSIRIYAGEGIEGTPLSPHIILPPPNSGTTWVSGYINIPVIAGNKYTISTIFRQHWYKSTNDIYAGGKAENDPFDRLFKTYVTGPVPHLIVDNNGNLGIGTNSATEKLVVKTTDNNYGLVHTNGSIMIGTYVGGSSIYGGWIGTKSNHPLLFFTNNGSSQMTLLQNGNVGIGTVDPVYKLQVSGLVAANDFVSTSDARLKKNIVPLKNALSTVLQLNGVSYYWNSESYPQYQFDTTHKIGFLAQEVEKIIPELVATGTDGYKTVNYIEVVPLLVESIKELQHRIDEQQRLNELLKAGLEKVKKRRRAK